MLAALIGYGKVEAIGFANNHVPSGDEEFLVPRANFQEFVVHLEELDPAVIEQANIEIIAPVLTRDGGKWRGRFEGRNISFVIHDEQFLTQVALKQVKFQNGTSMTCRLVVYLREDEAGVPAPHEYAVDEVYKLHSKKGRAYRISKTKVAGIVKPDVGNKKESAQQNLLLPDT